MPRFYLHIRRKGRGMSYDEFGLDYPDVESAWSAVVRAAQDLKHVFAARGQDPRDYAIEVEDETGEVVFRLPFSENLRPSLPQSHATYKIVGSTLGWLIYCDDEFVGGFAQRSSAELFVWEMVEARCAEHKASQVLIEDELAARSTFAAASRKRLPEPCCLKSMIPPATWTGQVHSIPDLSRSCRGAGVAHGGLGDLLAILVCRQLLQVLGRLEQVKLGFEERDLPCKGADRLSLMAILGRLVGAERIHDSWLR